MSVLDRLKSVVFEQEDPQEETATTPTTNGQTTEAPTTGQASPQIPLSTAYTVEQQKMFDGMLERLHAQVFTRTTALVQFRTALKSLEPVIADATTRYNAAYAMLKTSGVSIEALLNAIKVHTNDLESETTRFNDEIERQRQTVVVKPTTKIQELENAQQADKDTLTTIQERISARVAEIEKLKKEITDADNGVNTVAKIFEAAEITVAKILEQEATNITTYLK